MAGAFAILQDPIFNGMAISLLFGAGVATVMALVIIPLGCISARRQFYVETSDDGNVKVSAAFEMVEHEAFQEKAEKSGTSLLMRMWGGIFSLFSWIFLIIKAVFTMIGMGLKSLFRRSGGSTPPPPRPAPSGGGTPPPPRGGGTPPPPREMPPSTAKGTPPPPREMPPSTAKGTPPPSREVAPSTARGTPPPPREMPPSTAKGTPPPPREMPPSTAKGTPPPPREMPTEAKTETTPPVASEAPVVSAPKDSVAMDATESDDEGNGTVGKKRRGIRLKQDLD
jgi:hypothetical protein